MPGHDARPPAGAPPRFYGYTIVVAASMSMVLIFSVHYAFGVFFKPMSTEFGWTRAMTAGAFSLVWISQGLLASVMGGLNDRFGPRLVLTVSGCLIGAGWLLTSQISAVWQLYLFYGVMVGAGLGGTFVPLTSTTARWFVALTLLLGSLASGVAADSVIYLPLYSGALNDYVRRELEFESDLPYEVLTERVHPWNFGGGGTNGYLYVADTLRSTMLKNPQLKLLVGAGKLDLATPFLASDYTVNHLNLPEELRKNITRTYYPAGHMMYHDAGSRKQLHGDVAGFIRGATTTGMTGSAAAATTRPR